MPNLQELNIGLIVFTLFVLVTIAQLAIYLFTYAKVVFYKKKTASLSTQELPVSIIICAKNEGDNLTEYLPKILSQEYKNFEVVVVNDCSHDNTDDVLREYSDIFPNLKIITVKEDEYYKHGKKFALMVGIKGAKYDHLLLTDADCVPEGTNWLSKMAEGFADNKEIVLSYGAYQKKPGFLNKLIRFDTFLIGLNYLSLAMKNKAYMGVGRNLAYKKELFFKHKGFSGHYHIQSGDDDLFVNYAATRTNVAVVIDPESFTYSVPSEKFSQWKMQKQRHLSTAPFYKASTRFRLGYYYLVQYLFWLLFGSMFIFPEFSFIALWVFSLKMIFQFVIFNKAMKQLNEKDLLPLLLILDILLLFLYPYFHLTKKISKPNKWKN